MEQDNEGEEQEGDGVGKRADFGWEEAVLGSAMHANILTPSLSISSNPSPCGLALATELAQVQIDPKGSTGFPWGKGIIFIYPKSSSGGPNPPRVSGHHVGAAALLCREMHRIGLQIIKYMPQCSVSLHIVTARLCLSSPSIHQVHCHRDQIEHMCKTHRPQIMQSVQTPYEECLSYFSSIYTVCLPIETLHSKHKYPAGQV